MPLTELHKLAESDLIDQHNIKLHFKDVNTVNEGRLNELNGVVCIVGNTTPLHVALLCSKHTAVLFLISCGADVNLEFNDYGWGGLNGYTAVSWASEYSKDDLLPIVTGGADNARDILISEGLLEEGEKFVKPAKH